MNLAIIGDIHSNISNLKNALDKVKERGIDHIIVVGDLQNPDVCDIIGSTNIKVSIVFGNADFDREEFIKKTKPYNNIEILGDLGELQIDNIKIGFHHYHREAIEMAKSGEYDVVFSGHRHSPHAEYFGKTLYLRPGEIAGQFNPPTFAIFDTKTKKAELVFINR